MGALRAQGAGPEGVGALLEADEDTNGDGRPDKWETYEAGALKTASFDEDRDGKPDRRLTYAGGTLIAIDSQPDASGAYTRHVRVSERPSSHSADRRGQRRARRSDGNARAPRACRDRGRGRHAGRTILEGQPEAGLVVVLDLARPEALKFLRAPTVQRAGIPIICIADRRKPDASSRACGSASPISSPVRSAKKI